VKSCFIISWVSSEGKLSKGEPVDLDGYTRAASHLRRILETLGIQRKMKTIPSLQEYLAGKQETLA
jgi:hypothetical protein